MYLWRSLALGLRSSGRGKPRLALDRPELGHRDQVQDGVEDDQDQDGQVEIVLQ